MTAFDLFLEIFLGMGNCFFLFWDALPKTGAISWCVASHSL